MLCRKPMLESQESVSCGRQSVQRNGSLLLLVLLLPLLLFSHELGVLMFRWWHHIFLRWAEQNKSAPVFGKDQKKKKRNSNTELGTGVERRHFVWTASALHQLLLLRSPLPPSLPFFPICVLPIPVCCPHCLHRTQHKFKKKKNLSVVLEALERILFLLKAAILTPAIKKITVMVH